MEPSSDTARFNMIQQQVRPWNVLDDRVLEAMMAIPREDFVPEAYRGLAYADVEIPIGGGEQMLAPKIVGRLLEALGVTPSDQVLEIGTGTGYLTACLARLGGQVLSLELRDDLAEAARAKLAALGIENAEVRVGDGLAASGVEGSFDAIALTGSLPTEAPLAELKGRLKPGGRLFALVGEDPLMEAVLIERLPSGEYRQRDLFETSVPPLIGAPQPNRFLF